MTDEQQTETANEEPTITGYEYLANPIRCRVISRRINLERKPMTQEELFERWLLAVVTVFGRLRENVDERGIQFYYESGNMFADFPVWVGKQTCNLHAEVTESLEKYARVQFSISIVKEITENEPPSRFVPGQPFEPFQDFNVTVETWSDYDFTEPLRFLKRHTEGKDVSTPEPQVKLEVSSEKLEAVLAKFLDGVAELTSHPVYQVNVQGPCLSDEAIGDLKHGSIG